MIDLVSLIIAWHRGGLDGPTPRVAARGGRSGPIHQGRWSEVILILLVVVGCNAENPDPSGSAPPKDTYEPVAERITAEDISELQTVTPTLLAGQLGTDSRHADGLVGKVGAACLVGEAMVAVYDETSQRIVGFDLDQDTAWVLARSGDGPGEIREVAWMGSRGDTLLVLDRALGRLSRIHVRTGFVRSQAVRTQASPGYVHGSAERLPAFAAWDRGPSVDPFAARPGAIMDSSAVLVWRLESDTMTLVDSVPSRPTQFVVLRPDGPERSGSVPPILALPLPLPLSSGVSVAFLEDGWLVANSSTGRIERKATDGSVETVVMVAWPGPATDSYDAESLHAWYISEGAPNTRSLRGQLVESVELPEHLPRFVDLHVSREQELWLQLDPVPQRGEPVVRWLRLTPEGDPVEVMGMGAGERLLDIGLGRIVTLEKDALGVESVNVYGFR